MVCKIKTVFLLLGYLGTLTSGILAHPFLADELDIDLQNSLNTKSKSNPKDLLALSAWNSKQIDDVSNITPAENNKDDVIWPKRAAPEFNPSGWRRKRSVSFDDGMHNVAFKELMEQLQHKLNSQRGINRRGKPEFNPSGWRKKRSNRMSYNVLARFARDLVRGNRLRVKRQEEPQFNPSGW